jgi:23S rRNA (adenine2503-C2)-methyltransferase
MIKKLADDELSWQCHCILPSMKSVPNHAFSKNFPWLIYGNHWNIGTENKSKISYEYVVWKDINDNKESIDA